MTTNNIIAANDATLDDILSHELPAVLYMYDKPNKKLDSAFTRAASQTVGELAFFRVNARTSPQIHAHFDRPRLPALVTLDGGEIESEAAAIRPTDVEAHVDFLLGQGPYPTQTEAEFEALADTGALPIHVTDKSFKADVLKSHLPVLVDFWAPWCGPCHMVAPVLDRLAEQYAGQIKIAKLNVDDNPHATRRFKAMSIPLLLLFKEGKVIGRLVGAQPEPVIEQLIAEALE